MMWKLPSLYTLTPQRERYRIHLRNSRNTTARFNAMNILHRNLLITSMSTRKHIYSSRSHSQRIIEVIGQRYS